MRVLALALLVACGPKVDPKGPGDDLDTKPEPVSSSRAAEPAAPAVENRPEAPVGKGERKGTIARAKLLAVLDSGPGTFLRQFEVAPKKDGDRFVGWQLVQLIDRTGPLGAIDLAPGDVLLAVNGKPVSQPDQLQAVWDGLRTANAIRAQMWRGDAKFEIEFAIDPPVK
ncbi:MAG TPA: hypothetical protein VGC41_06050 [Kofleriaceae bacterium]